jgi:hypothetical protein
MGNNPSNFTGNVSSGVIGNAIWEAIKFIVGLVFTTSVCVYLSQLIILVVNLSYISQFRWILAVVAGSGGAWLFMVLREKYNRFRPSFPPLKFNFAVVERDVTYEYIDKTHMVYKKRVIVKALTSGLDSYRDRYSWTGRGNVAIRSGIREHEFTKTFRRNIWQFYEIRFQKALKKGEQIETEVIWKLEDTEGVAVPFMSSTIEEPTELLRLNLSLSPSLGVREATCEISSAIGAKLSPFFSEVRPLDRNGKLSWVIKKPKLLYHYEIKWVL